MIQPQPQQLLQGRPPAAWRLVWQTVNEVDRYPCKDGLRQRQCGQCLGYGMFPPKKAQLRWIKCLNTKRDTVYTGRFEACQPGSLHRVWVGLGGDFDIWGKAENLLCLSNDGRDQIGRHQAGSSTPKKDAAQS